MARSRSRATSGPGLPPVPWRVWRLAFVIVLGSFLSTLASSLVNVGIDTIGRAFRAPLADSQWLSSAYVVAFAATVPLSAWASRRVGAGRLWLFALTGFVLTSAACAIAPSLAVLVALRAGQGLTGALLLPTGQTIIGQAAGPQRMGRVMNMTKVVSVFGPVAGPAIGGLLIGDLSWRWLFLVNVPVGVLAIALGLPLVPRGVARRGPRFDLLGFVLVAAGLPLVLYGITAVGHAGGTQPVAVGTLVGGGVAVVLFVRRSLAVDHPLLDLRLFADRSYTAAVATVFCAGACLLGSLVLLPLYWQLLRGESVPATGLLMLAVGGGTAISMPLGGAVTDRIGGGPVAVIGLAIGVVSTTPMAFLPADIALPLALALQAGTGFGLGLAAMPALSAAYRTVPPDRLPDATSEANIVQRVGGSLGIALTAILLERHGVPTVGSFHTAFGWLTGTGLLAVLLAGWLTRTEARSRRAGRVPEVGAPSRR